ncbi:MAG: cupin domain-containing protein [Pyrinomonadaceae bacterium]
MLDLSKVEWRETRHEGVALKVLRRDEATGDATALIRMKPGCSYPAHRPVALAGEDCVMLAVAHGGIELIKKSLGSRVQSLGVNTSEKF